MNSPVFSYTTSMIDYPGCLAGIFLISGCNFKCGFCHNVELMSKKEDGFDWEKIHNICNNLKQNWINGIVITGGEPTLSDQLEQLVDIVRTYGFKIKLDTNGSRPDVLEKISFDYIAMDIKCSLNKYPELTGFNDVDRIKESIDIVKKNKDYEFRTTVIEKIHTKDEIVKISELISGAKRYVLQSFVPRDDLLDKNLTLCVRTSNEYLLELKKDIKNIDEIIIKS